MPAIYAHLRFGEEVAKTLPAPFTELIKRFPEAFHLGTQGPDILISCTAYMRYVCVCVWWYTQAFV